MKSKKDIEFFCTCKLNFLNEELIVASLDGHLGEYAAVRMLQDFSWLVRLGFCSDDDYVNFSHDIHSLANPGGDK